MAREHALPDFEINEDLDFFYFPRPEGEKGEETPSLWWSPSGMIVGESEEMKEEFGNQFLFVGLFGCWEYVLENGQPYHQDD